MKFKLSGNSPLKNMSGGGKIFKFLDSKTKQYALIGILVIIMLLVTIILFSSGNSDEIQFEEPNKAQLENNISEQGNIPPPPPPLDEDMLEAFDKGGEINSSLSIEELYPVDTNETKKDGYLQLDEEILKEFSEDVKVESEKNDTKPVEQSEANKSLTPSPIEVKENKILPVENNLSMSQRGISPEKIVETIDNISNAEFKCKCDCPTYPNQMPNANYGQQNIQGVQAVPPPPQNNVNCPEVNNNYAPNAFANNGKARIEIRPDDMIIYLKAKQPLMSFDGKNLIFENKSYVAGDIFKGWWKVEHINNVYARFMDDLSGYAYNLRFLDNQQGRLQ